MIKLFVNLVVKDQNDAQENIYKSPKYVIFI